MTSAARINKRFVAERRLKGPGRSLEILPGCWPAGRVRPWPIDRLDGFAQRGARGEIERNGRHRELSLVIDRQRDRSLLDARERAERHFARLRRVDVDVLHVLRVSCETRA